MTAKELIKELDKLNPDTTIIIRGYEEGFNHVLKLIPRNIVDHPNQQRDYYGEYTEIGKINKSSTEAVELWGDNRKSID